MKISIQVLKNILANWGSYFVGTIIGFLMMPFVVDKLGDIRYGVWILIMNMVGYLGLLDFGVSGSIAKYVAEYQARKDKDGLDQVCSTAFFIYLLFGALAFLGSIAIALYLVPQFKIPAEHLRETQNVAVIVGLEIAFTLPISFFSGYMRGMQRYDILAGIALGVNLVRSGFTILLLLRGHGLIALALLHLFTAIGSGIIKVVYVGRKTPDLKIQYRLVNREKISMVVSYSVHIFLYYIATRLIFAVDTLIIGYFLTAQAVTFYAIPQRLIEYLRVLIMATGVVLPTASHFDATGELEKIKGILIKGTKYSLIIALPVGIAYGIVGEEFLGLWMGPKYASPCYPVLLVLSIGILAHISQFTAIQVLQGINRHKFTAQSAIAEGFVKIALCYFLVAGYGNLGVAIGTAIPMVLNNLVAIPWYVCRSVRIPLRDYFPEAFLRPLTSGAVFGGVLFGMKQVWMPDSWLRLCMIIAVGLLAYGMLAAKTCFTREERESRFREILGAFGSLYAGLKRIPFSFRQKEQG
jgi:O-antigen/teichoic acid export membrane protein